MPLVYYIAYRAVSVKRFFKKNVIFVENGFCAFPTILNIKSFAYIRLLKFEDTLWSLFENSRCHRHSAQRAAGDMVIQSILRTAAAFLESQLLPAQKRAFPYGMPFPPFFINYVDSFLRIFIGTYKSIWSYPSASLISSVGLSICPMALCPGRSSSSKPLLSIHFRIPA